MTRIVTLTPSPAIDVSTSVPRLQPTQKLRCGPSRRDPGGGGVNVARAARRLGADVLAVYPSGGPIGELLDRLLANEAVPVAVIRTPHVTRENFSVREAETGRQFKFVLPGPPLDPRDEAACLEAVAAVGGQGGYVVCSGGLPPGTPADLYARVARTAKADGAQVVVDSHGPALAAALSEGVHLVKPSQDELAELLGEPLGDENAQLRACLRLTRAGQVEFVALSLGEQGALLVAREAAWRASSPKVVPLTSVGAGDSFLAALLVALGSGAAPDLALRQGVAAGAAALLGAGTELCKPADVARLADQVEVRSLPLPPA